MESSSSCADTKPQIKRLRLRHVWIEPTKDSHRHHWHASRRRRQAIAWWQSLPNVIHV